MNGASASSGSSSRTKLSSRRSLRVLRWPLGAALLPLALWACTGHPLGQPQPTPEQQTDLRYAVNPVRKLDLVFMIDNSSSMRDKQENLRKNFPSFMDKLLKIQGGAPDMHIAVISSNVGAGPTVPDSACPVGGDRGRFQVRPECGIDTAKNGYFLSIDAAGKTNFEDKGGLPKLPELFQCMAFLGDRGCGYEHQLLSLYFALDGKTNPENAGFLRDDAYLGVVMLTDEDDCSADPGTDIFAPPPIGGQAGSLRCSLQGHTCNGQAVPPTVGFSAPLSACAPYVRNDATEKTNRLVNVQFFVDFLKGLKRGDTDKILVSEIIGWSDDAAANYSITKNARGEIDTGPICPDLGAGIATPGLRLHAFAKEFKNFTTYPICQTDLSPAMDEIATRLARFFDETCIKDPLYDVNGDKSDGIQPDCQVDDLIPVSGSPGTFQAQSIVPCSAGRGMPCWDLLADTTCGGGYRTDVKRASPPPPDTLQSIKCLTCPGGDNDHCFRK
jgi:hypothetical protein